MSKRGVVTRWLALALALFALPLQAEAGRRVALVVGISNYTYSPRLKNPHSDAKAISSALSAAGFEVVQSLDQDLTSLSAALDGFYKKADGADAALFFFAGHGLQFDGVNYLVPRDAALRSETRLKQETIALQDIIGAIEKRAGLTLVFLDACRDNPLAEELQRSAKGQSRSAAVPRGLAPMAIRNPDTLLVYAAAPGRTASDGGGENSPFTTALLRNIDEPGVEIELLMKRVTRDVVQATGGEQVPERLSRLTTEFVFKAAPGGTAPSAAAAAQKAPAAPAPQIAALAPDRQPAAPPPVRKRGDCLLVGGRLDQPLSVQRGTRICADASRDQAVIRNITTRAVIYSVNGGYEISCNTRELCAFNWDGAPMFNVRILPGDNGGVAAELVAPGG